jgi:hypothetical protein
MGIEQKTYSRSAGYGWRSKAQSGVEYIIIVAFLLAVITPIFLFAMDSSTTSVRTSRSREAVEKIAIAADNICSMGGGKTTANVYIPYGVEYYVIEKKTIKLGIIIDSTAGEVFARTMCNVTGEIPTDEGYANVQVSMLSNGTILIGGT